MCPTNCTLHQSWSTKNIKQHFWTLWQVATSLGRLAGARLSAVWASGQPGSVPGDFLERVTRWAQNQADPVSVILFGSRARGDHGPESDWDFALVYEGECLSLRGLPSSLQGRDIDWAPIKRSRVISRLNVCGIQHAIAVDGRCLHGDPLPKPERSDVNIPDAWDLFFQSYAEMCSGMRDLADHWTRPPHRRLSQDTRAARRGSTAGELLCKAVLNMRGVEPRRSHSVAELCKDLDRALPADPLLPLLRSCDGLTAEAHVSVYADRNFLRETMSVSARRLAAVLRASGEMLSGVCDVSFTDEGRVWLRDILSLQDGLQGAVHDICSTDCPRDIQRQVQAGFDAWPDSSELWDRLLAEPLGRAPERAARRRAKGR